MLHNFFIVLFVKSLMLQIIHYYYISTCSEFYILQLCFYIITNIILISLPTYYYKAYVNVLILFLKERRIFSGYDQPDNNWKYVSTITISGKCCLRHDGGLVNRGIELTTLVWEPDGFPTQPLTGLIHYNNAMYNVTLERCTAVQSKDTFFFSFVFSNL